GGGCWGGGGPPPAAVVGPGVVNVAHGGAEVAPWCGADRVPGPDQVLEFAGGPVPVCLLRVVTGSPDDLVQGLYVQHPVQLTETARCRWPGRPVPGPGGAAMGGGGPAG